MSWPNCVLNCTSSAWSLRGTPNIAWLIHHNPHLSFRNTAGIHQAIRIISRLASEQCGKMIDPNDLSDLAE